MKKRPGLAHFLKKVTTSLSFLAAAARSLGSHGRRTGAHRRAVEVPHLWRGILSHLDTFKLSDRDWCSGLALFMGWGVGSRKRSCKGLASNKKNKSRIWIWISGDRIRENAQHRRPAEPGSRCRHGRRRRCCSSRSRCQWRQHGGRTERPFWWGRWSTRRRREAMINWAFHSHPTAPAISAAPSH